MPIEIKVPQLTQTMTEAEIVRWIKTEGEQVKVGEPLLEVVTDKATVDVESPSAGVLGKILVPSGIAPVGKVICVLLGQGEQLGETHAGSVAETAANDCGARAASPVPGVPQSASSRTGKIRISPLAKRLAAEKGVEVGVLVPSGPGSLIVEKDVKAYLASQVLLLPLREGRGEGRPGAVGAHGHTPLPGDETPGTGEAARAPRLAAETPALPAGPLHPSPFTLHPSSDDEVIPLVGVRRIIADRMTLSRHTAADVTTVAEVDMGEISALREHLPFTYTAFAARAVTIALTEFPILNSRLDGDRIVVKKRVHLGVAVAIDEGLKVPVLKDVQALSLRQVSEMLADKAKRGAEGKLSPEELSGSTFTLTNSGVFGSLFFTPIINPPESAILGMGKIMKTPVVRDDQVVIRPMMYLCLTYDHRVVDGAPAVKFLQRVKALLENPALML